MVHMEWLSESEEKRSCAAEVPERKVSVHNDAMAYGFHHLMEDHRHRSRGVFGQEESSDEFDCECEQ